MKHPDRDLGRLAKAVDTGIDADEIAKSILFQWADPEQGLSGADGLGKALKDCHDDAPGGGQVRARILHDAVTLIVARSTIGGSVDDDLEELEAEFQDTMDKFQGPDG